VKNGNHKKPTFEWVTVDVDTAYKYLESMQDMNRPVIKSKLDQYVSDRKEGRWVEDTVDPFKFDWDGRLFEGQHRCWMVIETGMPTTFLVARNCDPAERGVSGTGAPRSVRDTLFFQGVKAQIIEIAIANAMGRSYLPTYKPTKQQQREYYLLHREAVGWTVQGMHKRSRGIGQAAMLAPVARAWYSEGRARLTRYLEVFREGIPADESEHVIILARNYALEKIGSKHGGHYESYGRAERALRAYLDGELLKVLKPLSQEVFPVPGEAGAKKWTPRKRKGGAV